MTEYVAGQHIVFAEDGFIDNGGSLLVFRKGHPGVIKKVETHDGRVSFNIETRLMGRKRVLKRVKFEAIEVVE